MGRRRDPAPCHPSDPASPPSSRAWSIGPDAGHGIAGPPGSGVRITPDYFLARGRELCPRRRFRVRLYTRVREERGLAYSVYSGARSRSLRRLVLRRPSDQAGRRRRGGAREQEEMARMGRGDVSPRELDSPNRISSGAIRFVPTRRGRWPVSSSRWRKIGSDSIGQNRFQGGYLARHPGRRQARGRHLQDPAPSRPSLSRSSDATRGGGRPIAVGQHGRVEWHGRVSAADPRALPWPELDPLRGDDDRRRAARPTGRSFDARGPCRAR